jgi:hypothetical protein
VKKTKFKEIIKSTSVPLYDFVTLELVLTNDMRASEAKRGIGAGEIGAAHTLGGLASDSVVVMLPARPSAHLVAHEGVHVATHALRASGSKAGLKNDEPIAYLVDWFVKWVENVTK